MRNVIGLYHRLEDAMGAIRALNAQGFRKEDMTLIAHDVTGRYSRALDEVKSRQGQNLANGAATGAGIGGILGGIIGLLLGLGTLAIAALSPLAAAGPVIATVMGVIVGAVVGGIVGVLIDLSIPENTARVYEEGLRQGGTLLIIRTIDEWADRAAETMNRFKALDVDRKASWWQEEFETHPPDEIQIVTPPLSEVLAVQDSTAFKEWSVEYLELVEEPVVRKEVQVAEEVRVYREVRERDQTIRDTVRRQEVETERTQTGINRDRD